MASSRDTLYRFVHFTALQHAPPADAGAGQRGRAVPLAARRKLRSGRAVCRGERRGWLFKSVPEGGTEASRGGSGYERSASSHLFHACPCEVADLCGTVRAGLTRGVVPTERLAITVQTSFQRRRDSSAAPPRHARRRRRHPGRSHVGPANRSAIIRRHPLCGRPDRSCCQPCSEPATFGTGRAPPISSEHAHRSVSAAFQPEADQYGQQGLGVHVGLQSLCDGAGAGPAHGSDECAKDESGALSVWSAG